jgi:hypothetical protein
VRYIECPDNHADTAPSLFLAGGVTGCPDWQSEVVSSLSDLPLVLLNPRRKDFPILDPTASEGQISWEHRHLRGATAILFWFPEESICPITLYELGAWSMTSKPLFVGVHPSYPRRADVEIQTRLVRPDIHVAHSLAALTSAVRLWSPSAPAAPPTPARPPRPPRRVKS